MKNIMYTQINNKIIVKCQLCSGHGYYLTPIKLLLSIITIGMSICCVSNKCEYCNGFGTHTFIIKNCDKNNITEDEINNLIEIELIKIYKKHDVNASFLPKIRIV